MTVEPSTIQYPDALPIKPLEGPARAVVRVPGSKSITNRALVLAALSSAESPCELRGALRSEDTCVMIDALWDLGFRVEADWCMGVVGVSCEEGTEIIPAKEADLFVGNSGTTMRFLTALVSLGWGRYRLDGVPRMRERPIEDLLGALRQLGVRAFSEKDNGCPPVIVEADGLKGGTVRIKGDISSQFLSGVLMIAPHAQGEVTVEVDGPLVSWPYVAMTVQMMQRWHYAIESQHGVWFRIPGRQRSARGGFEIEPDASAASYFFGAAAVSQGEVTVPGLGTGSLQGDIRFVEVLEEMGCQVVRGDRGLTVRGGLLHGLDVDMNDISDCVMTLAAVALFADGPTTIRNVAHIRHKETDRLAALAAELRRLGAEVEEFADGLTITPRPLHGATVRTYNDHRMAMSLALVGLRVPGVVIHQPGCVAKTYPNFFVDLERLRACSDRCNYPQ
jgi:3-phosphoshikimate 1-carboxyvinyltransferase